VATVSCVAAPTTGVSVDSHNTMSRTTTLGRQDSLTNTPTSGEFLESRIDSRFYKADLGGGV